MRRAQWWAWGVVGLWGTGLAAAAAQTGDDQLELPPGLAPLEYLAGRWNGQGVPLDKPGQRFRGWTENHSWAWVFKSGKPVGLAVEFKGNKSLASGKLSYDAARSRYVLAGQTSGARPAPIELEGTYDPRLRQLVLSGADPVGGKLRISLRPNADSIRYTVIEERQPADENRFHRVTEIGLGREGESLAAGSTGGEEKVKCIVTGGAATMTVSYKGQTFPICCTGCRDEFNDNPEKYIKKAALRLAAEARKPKAAAPARVSARDDAFADDVVETRAAMKRRNAAAAAAQTTAVGSESSKNAEPAKTTPATQKTATAAARAAASLANAERLEKQGKTQAALALYRILAKSYPGTPAAKTAAERIKALEK